MNAQDTILAALSPGDGDTYSPVQIQKLLFLIDRRIPSLVDGPHFDFAPYDYGPFDRRIYEKLEQLSDAGLVQIIREPNLRWSNYRLTSEGMRRGREILNTLGAETVTYITELCRFVRRLSFAELVGAIYKEYPEMKVNSVFRG